MSIDVDWQHELDTSFGAGQDVPAGHYVAAGRTAVRRRRAASVAIVAAMAVGVGAAWASGPGGAPRGDAPVATSGPAPAQPNLTDKGEVADKRAEREARRQRLDELRAAIEGRIDFMGNPAALADHGLVLAPRTDVVLQRVHNPMGYTEEQGRSVAIRVLYEGREQYSLMSWFPDSTSTSTVEATGDFAGWLDGAVRTQRTLDVANGVTPSSGDTSDPPWLTLTPGGEVESTRPGIVLVEVHPGVDLGAAFATGSDRTGAVRLLVDGRSEFAVYRVVDSRLEVIPGGGSFASLDAFIDWARQQYASGAGLR